MERDRRPSMRRIIGAFVLCAGLSHIAAATDTHSILLNGEWEGGLGRDAAQRLSVPGVVTTTDRPSPGDVWLRREVTLPGGAWNHATVLLKGAAFSPAVLVNGETVSERAGGLAPTRHPLRSPAVRPGETITLEVRLKSLKDIAKDDPSRIGPADHVRCNTSSWIWDDVVLKTHGRLVVDKVVPVTHLAEKAVDVTWSAAGWGGGMKTVPSRVDVDIIGRRAMQVAKASVTPTTPSGTVRLTYGDGCLPWTPDAPRLWHIRVTLWDGEQISDRYVTPWAPREFKLRPLAEGTGFELNGNPIDLRGAGIAWRDWTRDESAHALMHDTEWFRNHLFVHMKRRGANVIQWHRHAPPERLLDLCDEMGIMCAIEWHFDDDFDVDPDQLREQWHEWFKLLQRHPSVVLVRPYGESTAKAAKTLMTVAAEQEKQFQPTLIVHRDVRAPKRKSLLATSAGKTGEYQRRQGDPWISHACILGCGGDASPWYEGDPAEGKLTRAWDEIAPVWSARSCSLEFRNRNVLPGASISAPLHMFNDVEQRCDLLAELRVVDTNGTVRRRLGAFMPSDGYSRGVQQVTYALPEEEGRYWIEAEMLTKAIATTAPVVSRWEVFAMTPQAVERVTKARCAVPEADGPLRAALLEMGVQFAGGGDAADLLITGTSTWKAIQSEAPGALAAVDDAVSRGVPVVMLDVGPAYMGEGDPATTYADAASFIRGGSLLFTTLREGASRIHPTEVGKPLWRGMHPTQMWLWNGGGGGVIVPAVTMEVAMGQQAKVVPLARCGSSLRAPPVVRVDIDGVPVILSQLLTSDRLKRPDKPPAGNDFTYDPAASQMVLNILDYALRPAPQ